MTWDNPLDPPLEAVTDWPRPTAEPTQLQLIEMVEDVPQMYRPRDDPTYPADLVALTDRLHDDDHVELGLMVLAQYTKLERLIAFSRFILDVDS